MSNGRVQTKESLEKKTKPFKFVVVPHYVMKYYIIPDDWSRDPENMFDTGYSLNGLRRYFKLNTAEKILKPYLQGSFYIELYYLREIHRLDCLVKQYELKQKTAISQNETVQRILNERIQRVRVPQYITARRKQGVSQRRQSKTLQDPADAG